MSTLWICTSCARAVGDGEAIGPALLVGMRSCARCGQNFGRGEIGRHRFPDDCPNCGRPAPGGLYHSAPPPGCDLGVMHCGCYHEPKPDNVFLKHHVSEEREPKTDVELLHELAEIAGVEVSVEACSTCDGSQSIPTGRSPIELLPCPECHPKWGRAFREAHAKQDEARARLRILVPHLKVAAEMALLKVPGGAVELGVIAKNPDGSGHVAASFLATEFLADLETLLEGG